jgi:hypothetical protein
MVYEKVGSTVISNIGFFVKGITADGVCSESSTETLYNPLYDQVR